ncbi:MAG: hypothetical protein ABFC80_08745 [Coriobacteriales bacterium]
MIQSPILTDFTGGELSPKFSGRVDLQVYARGCLTLENWVPFSQGGVTTRPGSKYLATTKNNVLGRLQPWTLGSGTSYMMEFTALVLRFWTTAGALFGAPLELTTPFATAAACRALSFAQDGDKMFVTHPDYAPQIITWTGSTFSIASAVFVWNPGDSDFASSNHYPHRCACFGQRLWLGPTNTERQTVWASRSFIYAEARGTAWQASTAYEIGDICINDTGKLYVCSDAGTSAAAGGPTGTGSAIVDNTAKWDYWCASGSIDMTYYERLRYDVQQLQDPTLWPDPDIPETEVVSVYRNIVSDAAAMKLPIYSDRSDRIQTLIAGAALIIGTQYSEYIINADITALAPQVHRQSGNGCQGMAGVLVKDSVLFLQKHGRRLLEWTGGEAASTPDLTFFADHILGTSGAVEMDFATYPEPCIYALRSDGEIAVLVYNKLVGTQAWCRYVPALAGTYKSVGVTLGTATDQVWCIVLRGAQYCVEIFDDIWSTTATPLDGWVDVATAGATVTGLERFASKTATIWNVTESAVYTAAVTAGGVLTTPALCVGDHLIIGGCYTCTGQTMKVSTDGPYGTGQMRIRKITKVTARVLASYPFKFGRTNTAAALESVVFSSSPYTGDVDCPIQGDWNRDTWVYFVQDQPYHSTILALVPQVET